MKDDIFQKVRIWCRWYKDEFENQLEQESFAVIIGQALATCPEPEDVYSCCAKILPVWKDCLGSVYKNNQAMFEQLQNFVTHDTRPLTITLKKE